MILVFQSKSISVKQLSQKSPSQNWIFEENRPFAREFAKDFIIVPLLSSDIKAHIFCRPDD